MAWPLQRLVTFVARTVPVISADDFLNAIQDWVVDLSLGLVSVKGITCDGTGGAAVPGPIGCAKVTRDIASPTIPTPDATDPGEVHKYSAPAAVGSITTGFDNAAEIGFGIYSTARLTPGSRVTLQAKPTGGNAKRSVVLCTGINGAGFLGHENKSVDGQGRLVLDFKVTADLTVDFAAWVF